MDSRLAAAAAALAAACVWAAVVQRAWPVEVAALMVASGLVLDALLWNRLDYQPGWAALPLGAVELAVVMALVRALGIAAPPREALLLFAAAWLAAQVLGHAVLPLAHLTYAEDAGELGRAGPVLALVALGLVAGAAGVARASQPPAVALSGFHRGPLVIDRAETLVGHDAVVRGGILVRASDVTIRGVAVEGGENGIDVANARNVRLEHVRISGARLDGIHVRDASVLVRDCNVSMGHDDEGQGIDISFTMESGMSVVRGCTLTGGREGIVVHTSMVDVRGNDVRATRGEGISLTEMSMGSIHGNRISGALGVGILCADSSECEIARNVVGRVRPDVASGDLTRMGYGIEAHYNAHVLLHANRAARIHAFLGSEIRRD